MATIVVLSMAYHGTVGTLGTVGSMAAEKLGIPSISGDLFPMLIPTVTASLAPHIPLLGPRLNRLTWRFARSARLARQLRT